ncbi:class I SAM-dependent methyltransferase [Patescibacteria group bacterium]|nr:class I SAM-dependent methyltransferase [Patescibacteria group bacterium]
MRYGTERDHLVCDGPDVRHSHPVVQGVPDLRAPIIERDQAETVDAFSAKWDFDPDAVREERFRFANAWFLDRFAASWVHRGEEMFLSSGRPSPEVELGWFLRGKHRILDAGCGLGNLTTMIAESAPHAEVWGVDLSTAILKWANKAPGNVRLVRCDLRNAPIDGQFDLIVSDGVLHHTPNTRESVHALARRLTLGGDLLFHVYRKKAPVREFADDHVRGLVSGMSTDDALRECRALTSLGRQLREARVSVTLDEPIESLGIPAGTHDLQRLVYWYLLKCFWDDGGNVNASIIENFDWYRPKLAWRHDEDEVRGWIVSPPEHGPGHGFSPMLELVHLTPCESGFSVHARRRV